MLKKLVASVIFLSVAAPALADDVTYRKDIRPLWQAKCSACHGAASPYLGDFMADQEKFKQLQKGPRMDTYADLIFYVGWPDTGAITVPGTLGVTAHIVSAPATPVRTRWIIVDSRTPTQADNARQRYAMHQQRLAQGLQQPGREGLILEQNPHPILPLLRRSARRA